MSLDLEPVAGSRPVDSSIPPRVRIADLLCKQCTVRCEQRWPVAGDFHDLRGACAGCRDRGRRVHRERSSDRLQAPTLPDLTAVEFDHQTATHEAGHAVVATLIGLPVLTATSGEATVDTCLWRDRPASGRVVFDASFIGTSTVPVRSYLAMVWAGQQAGLRWLRDHGHDTPANRIDERYLSRFDTAEADRWIRRCRLEDCAEQDSAEQFINIHWAAVTAVGDRLRRAQRLDGATIRRIIAATKQTKETWMPLVHQADSTARSRRSA
jgi:hypothetical protein